MPIWKLAVPCFPRRSGHTVVKRGETGPIRDHLAQRGDGFYNKGRMLILMALISMQGLAQYTGNAVCGDCHRNIVKRYAGTAMSREGVLCENCHGQATLHVKGA